MIEVRHLTGEDLPEIVGVLCESFFDYPVMRFVLGDPPDYPERLRSLVTFFTMARVHRGETMLGAHDESGVLGVALTSWPGERDVPEALGALREATWARLGEEARSRYEAYGEAASAHEIEQRHLHLGMIGTRTRARGQGAGRVLLDAVHRLRDENGEEVGVSLNTEEPANVDLYRHFGYEVLGSAPFGGSWTTWSMFRPA